MTSSINPNNIDGAYPVAGQDNDSQGFRDNFTNIRTNFGYAASEITDLQNKVVLKQALTGTTLDNDMGGNVLKNAQLQDISQTAVELVDGFGSRTIDYSAGSYYTMRMNGAVTLAFTNFPSTGELGVAYFQATILANTDTSITVPSSAINGASSLNASNVIGMVGNVLKFPIVSTDQTYVLEFWTTSQGSPLYIKDMTRASYSGSEAVSTGGVCSLNTTVSYFSTSGVATSTLAAGTSGQVKTLVMKSGGGDMVVTVTNPGWTSDPTGVITLTGTGTTCTLQYIIVDGTNGRWFCIANNGAVFS